MSEEKQIDEMAKALNEATFGVNTQTLADHLKPETINKVAEYLYNAGYRKQRVGEWIDNDDMYTADMLNYRCSICGEHEYVPQNFCCGCGAKMKGGAE